MANLKISQLTETTTPLVTDVLPIVSEGTTKKVTLSTIYSGVPLQDLSILNTLSANWETTYTTVQENSSTNWNYQGTDLKELSANWESTYNTVWTNSANWDAAFSSAGSDLAVRALTANWQNTYNSVQTNSATNWNNSLVQEYIHSNFLALTGGTISGPINFNDSVTILGNLSCVGSQILDNTQFITLSASDTIWAKNNNSDQWSSTYNTVLANSATNWNYQGTDLKELSANWQSAYSTVLANSATNWDNALANQYTHANFLPLSGGTVTGATRFNNDVTIFGNLSCSGTQTFANTVFTTTSAVSVVHFGSGPALWVGNNGPGDIASFYDTDQGIEVFHIGGANGDFPNVGVKTSTPNKDFTVNGEISASSTIWAKDSNSDQWTSVYSTVQANSSVNWNYQGTDLKDLSANWQNTYTTVWSKSANWEAASSSAGSDIAVRALTANWESTYTTVLANSSVNWNYQGTDLKDLSANWQNTYNTVQANSSVNWNYQGTDLKDLSANWQNTYTSYRDASGTFATSTTVNNVSSLLVLNTTFNNYQTTVASATATLLPTTTYQSASANWQNTFTTVRTNSANWVLEDFIVACSDETTSLVALTSAITFRVPYAMFLNTIRASVNTAPAGSTIIVDVKQNNTSIFSTKLSIDQTEKTSTTAATPVVISNRNLLDDSEVVVVIDQVGSTTPGRGLKLTFKGYRVV